jgi:threonine dehydrogenase-like Zn-dependent dehydrogenase
VIRDHPVPEPGPLEVLVRTTMISFCAGDVSRIDEPFIRLEGYGDGGYRPNGPVEERKVPVTIVNGHEAIGVVEQVGSLVDAFVPGDRVVGASTQACGTCRDCQRGQPAQCRGISGSYHMGMTRDGNMAEYFLVPNAAFNLANVPDSVGDEHAVLVPDTICTGFSGPESAGIPLGGTVAVFGQGHIGLAAMVGAHLMGAGRVIAVKATSTRLDLSRKLGADVVIAEDRLDAVDEIMQLTDGRGVDVSLVATGLIEAVANAVKATRPGGTICDMSHYGGRERPGAIGLPLDEWGWGISDKRFLSTLCKPGSDRVERILRLIAGGRVDLTPLISHRFAGFSSLVEALELARVGEPGFTKAVVAI